MYISKFLIKGLVLITCIADSYGSAAADAADDAISVAGSVTSTLTRSVSWNSGFKPLGLSDLKGKTIDQLRTAYSELRKNYLGLVKHMQSQTSDRDRFISAEIHKLSSIETLAAVGGDEINPAKLQAMIENLIELYEELNRRSSTLARENAALKLKEGSLTRTQTEARDASAKALLEAKAERSKRYWQIAAAVCGGVALGLAISGPVSKAKAFQRS